MPCFPNFIHLHSLESLWKTLQSFFWILSLAFYQFPFLHSFILMHYYFPFWVFYFLDNSCSFFPKSHLYVCILGLLVISITCRGCFLWISFFFFLFRCALVYWLLVWQILLSVPTGLSIILSLYLSFAMGDGKRNQDLSAEWLSVVSRSSVMEVTPNLLLKEELESEVTQVLGAGSSGTVDVPGL